MENQVFGKGRLDGSEQRFFLGTEEVPGIQSLNYNYSFPFVSSPYLGNTKIPVVRNGNATASFSLNHLLISDDLFLPYTGSFGFNGYLMKGRRNLEQNVVFTSGYLNSYNCSCSIGQIPQINIEATIYNGIGNDSFLFGGNSETNTISNSSSAKSLKIAHPGSITINLNDLTNQTIDSFNLSISVPRTPIYKLGYSAPEKIEKGGVTEVSCSFIVKQNDYLLKSIGSYPFSEYKNNLSITINDFKNDINILTYSFKNMRLFNQSYGVSPNNENVLSLAYQGFYL